jgi:hypothetical protein
MAAEVAAERIAVASVNVALILAHRHIDDVLRLQFERRLSPL